MIFELALGIDIGGTNTVYGFFDRNGKNYSTGIIKTDNHEKVEDFIDELCLSIKASIKSLNFEYELKGIGIGAPNANYYKSTIENAANLRWKGIINLSELLKKHFQLPIFVTNDANAAAIGEMVYGGAKGLKDFMMITLGTGLGSGIVANGKLIYGHDGFAGEVGHMIVVPNGRMCNCGRRGCLETYVSATGLKRTVFHLFADSVTTSELRKISFDDLTSLQVSEAAEKGDKIALEAFDYTARILGHALANVVAVNSPKTIFIFGGLAKAGDLLLKPTKKYMEESMLSIFANKVAIVPSHLGDDAAIVGASALVWNELDKK